MRRFFKFLFIFFIFFTFNNIVYASDQCFYMHGQNNKVIVPKGYNARCYYAYEKSLSNNGGRNDYHKIAVDFSKDGIAVSTADKSDNITNSFLRLKSNMHPSVTASINWDGLQINTNSEISIIEYDENINGCPKSIYWVDNSIDHAERYMVFSSSMTPSLSPGKNATYAVYTLFMDTDDQIIFMSDEPDGYNIYSYPESGTYDEEVAKCNSNNIVKPDSSGYGEHHTTTTDPKIENLKSCTYYFGLENYSGACQDASITFTYRKTTVFDSVSQKNKSTLSVVSDTDYDLALDSIQSQIDKVNKNNDYSYLNDFLVQKNGSFECADKIYIWNIDKEDDVVFGKSMLESFENDKAGRGKIVESKNSNSDLCPKKEGTINPDGSIEWGDPADVNCDGIIGKELLDFINKIFRWIQIIAPIFVIIMGSVDFASAVLQDDKDALKKATTKFAKRLIIAVALFFIPILLSFILDIFNGITGAYSSTCGIGGK